jgi:predicted DNA-binding transcriptional regulator
MLSPKEILEKSIVYWVGYVEEANQNIELLERLHSEPMKERLKVAKQKRDEALRKIAELGGTADFIRSLLPE